MINSQEGGPAVWGRPARAIAGAVLALMPFLVLFLARPYWTHLVVACIAAALLRPLAGLLHARLHFPRALAVVVTILLMLAVLLVPLLLLPALASSLVDLLGRLGEYVPVAMGQLADGLRGVAEVELLGMAVDLSPLVDPLVAYLETSAQRVVQGELSESVLRDVVGVTLGLTLNTVSLVVAGVFTLIFAVYLIIDTSWIQRGIEGLVPPDQLREWRELARHLLMLWKTYFVSQLGVMAAVGVIVTIAAWLIGLPYPLALGFIAGLLEIIPNLGPLLAAVPAVALALFEGSTRFSMHPLLFAVLVGATYGIIQLFEDSVLTPSIQGHAVEMPPPVIMLSVLVGAHEFGLLGGILAVPVVVSARVILGYLYAKAHGRDPFLELDAGAVAQSDSAWQPEATG
jgi:predicted PurR-regulated permease PerM